MWIKVERLPRLWRGRRWVGVLCLACLGELAAASIVAAAELPSEIRQALLGNVQAISPISASWTEQLGSDMPLQDWLKAVKYDSTSVDEFEPIAGDLRLAGRNVVLGRLAKQGGPHGRGLRGCERQIPHETGCQARESASHVDPRRKGMRSQASVCRQLRRGIDRDGHGTRISIDFFAHPKIYSSETYIFLDPLCFREAGFVLPHTVGMHRSGAKSLPLALIEEGARITKVEETLLDGQKCVLLELEDKDHKKRFYLDPTHGHAVCRREEMTRLGQVTEVSRMSDFTKFAKPDLWLPKRCDVAYYTWSTIPEVIREKPLARRTIVVRDIDKKAIPVERFRLKYTIARD